MRVYASQHPILDGHGLVEHLGLQLMYTPLGERDGAFDPEHGVIFINSLQRPERQRFTLAHEIAHVLLQQDDDLLSDLHDSYYGDELEQHIETLCNVGAASLLISEEQLHSASKPRLKAQSIVRLAQNCQVSMAVAMVALAEYSQQRAFLAICSPSADRTLRVHFSKTSGDMPYTLGEGTPIPADHPIEVSFHTGLALETPSFVPFRSGKQMPAFISTYPQKSRVVCVLSVGS